MFKYIIYENYEKLEVPILFPYHINHDDMARKLNVKPVSAGFVKILGKDEVIASGKSLSLGIGSREKDSELILYWMTES